jgi:uncharacterized protein
VGADEIERLLNKDLRREVVGFLKEIGFTYVTLDLQGYRTGAMNERLQDSLKENKAVGRI